MEQNLQPMASDSREISREMNYSTQGQQQALPMSMNSTFSIATPTVTTILPMTENMTDSSFMLPATSYSQESFHSLGAPSNELPGALVGSEMITKRGKNDFRPLEQNNNSTGEPQKTTLNQETEAKSSSFQFAPIISSGEEARLTARSKTGSQEDQEGHSACLPGEAATNSSKNCKKRNKINKSSTKLDAKSKLEKSRQSARECRARKKLRYQYLEDLVCNREKAVVQLREELSMFCDLSKKIDLGSISDQEAKLLVDQTKENNRNEQGPIMK